MQKAKNSGYEIQHVLEKSKKIKESFVKKKFSKLKMNPIATCDLFKNAKNQYLSLLFNGHQSSVPLTTDTLLESAILKKWQKTRLNDLTFEEAACFFEMAGKTSYLEFTYPELYMFLTNRKADTPEELNALLLLITVHGPMWSQKFPDYLEMSKLNGIAGDAVKDTLKNSIGNLFGVFLVFLLRYEDEELKKWLDYVYNIYSIESFSDLVYEPSTLEQSKNEFISLGLVCQTALKTAVQIPYSKFYAANELNTAKEKLKNWIIDVQQAVKYRIRVYVLYSVALAISTQNEPLTIQTSSGVNSSSILYQLYMQNLGNGFYKYEAFYLDPTIFSEYRLASSSIQNFGNRSNITMELVHFMDRFLGEWNEIRVQYPNFTTYEVNAISAKLLQNSENSVIAQVNLIDDYITQRDNVLEQVIERVNTEMKKSYAFNEESVNKTFNKLNLNE